MTVPDDTDVQLSAYLAGELDAAATVEFEARLADDPELAARLDALAGALVRLRGLDDVEPPTGYAERLRARLDSDAGEVATAAEARTGGAVVDLGAERARRRAPWAPLGAVAAGVAALAVVVSVTGPPGMRDEQVAGPLMEEDADMALEALEAPAAPDDMAAGEAQSDVGQDGVTETGRAAAGEDGAPVPAPAPAAGSAEGFAPVILDSEVALADEAAVRERYRALPEAQELLGLERDEAEDRAAAVRIAVQRAEPFASGVHPGSCLDIVSTSTDAPVIVARVESAAHEGVAAIVYVTVTSSGGAGALDRVEAWVVEPESCATRLYLNVT